MGGFNYHPLTHTTPYDRCRMLADIQRMIDRSRGTIRKINPGDVASILAYSNMCGASDPKDKVYGTLALFEGQLVSVDYRKTVAEVYQEFTRAAIAASESLSILHLAGTRRIQANLPSWVPDFSVTTP